MPLLTHAGPSVVAAFLASLAEFVEAMTVVLAVGVTRGWRPALLGTALGLAPLVVLVALLGPALALVPLGALQLMVGSLLLLFGLRWLRKAVLRAAGIIPSHDETAAFASETAPLRAGGQRRRWDLVGIATAFKIVVLEGLEVVFIVIAVGAASGLLLPASLGACAALVVVIALGLTLHRPLAQVPENTLKLIVGVLLSAFGTFWAGEGIGIVWPGADWAALGLVVGFAATAALGIAACRAPRLAPGPERGD